MRLLITGATGYIGSRLAAWASERGWQVAALVRPQSDLSRLPLNAERWTYDGSLNSVTLCCSAVRPDVTIHLAANQNRWPGPNDLSALIESNLLFGVQLLEALAAAGCTRFLNAGTFTEYDEHSNYAPKTLYDATKRAFRELTRFYSEARGFQIRTLVLYDVYGPGDWRSKLLPSLVDAMVTRSHIPATAGRQALDLVHVDDTCDGLLMSAAQLASKQGGASEVFALRSGRLVTVRELVGLLEKLGRQSIDVGWGELAYRPSQIFRAPQAIPLPPDWRCAIDLETGLGGLIEAGLKRASPLG